MRNRMMTVAMLTAALLLGASAQADILAQHTGDDPVVRNWLFGQSVTMEDAGGPWNNIQFNFVSTYGDPYAIGKLYIFDAPYLGYVNALVDSSYLAATAGITNGVWQFDSSVTLSAGTKYWFYMDTAPTIRVAYWNVNGYAGGNLAYAPNNTLSYTNDAGADMAFTLQGTPVGGGDPVPEPATLSLLGLGLAGLATRRLRRKA